MAKLSIEVEEHEDPLIIQFDATRFVTVGKCEYAECIFNKADRCSKDDRCTLVLDPADLCWLCEDFKEGGE